MACGAQDSARFGQGLKGTDARIQAVPYNRSDLLANNKIGLITPTGERILASAKHWMKAQEKEASRFAQPAQCAVNVSRVLEDADLTRYSSPLVPEMVERVRSAGGLVVKLPKGKRAIAAVIEKTFHGRIPVGTFVSGCLNEDCSGEAGDGHISLVGDSDSSGQVQLYHNNWYRPDNEGGIWKPHMIPLAWYQKGFLRKWMPTPWLYLHRTPESGRVENISVILPAIDDLDPTNYFVTLSVPREVLRELKKGQGVQTDGLGKVQAVGAWP